MEEARVYMCMLFTMQVEVALSFFLECQSTSMKYVANSSTRYYVAESLEDIPKSKKLQDQK